MSFVRTGEFTAIDVESYPSVTVVKTMTGEIRRDMYHRHECSGGEGDSESSREDTADRLVGLALRIDVLDHRAARLSGGPGGGC